MVPSDSQQKGRLCFAALQPIDLAGSSKEQVKCDGSPED